MEAAQATGIARSIPRNRFWKGSYSHFPTSTHRIKKTFLIILHFSNFLCVWGMQISLHSLNLRWYFCSIPGKRFCLCATGCIISWQSRGLSTADGPQSHGEFGCSSGETCMSPLHFRHLSAVWWGKWKSTRLELHTLNASACHRQYHMGEN